MNKHLTYDFGDGENVFFTSDTHFWHENIIHMCDRPFSSVEEMNQALIDNWNSVVGKNDIVFHLGDFAWGGPTKWNQILEQLNGNIYLILGNHDFKNLKDNSTQYFVDILPKMHIKIDGWTLWLNHEPLHTYGGAWSPERLVANPFGHTHYKDGSQGLDCKGLRNIFPSQYDVGVDYNNYTPISWTDLKHRLEKQMYYGRNMIEYDHPEIEMSNPLTYSFFTKKADEWLSTHLPKVLNEDMRKDFRNYMNNLTKIK